MNINNYNKVVYIAEGLKIWMPNEESCHKLQRQLNNIGVKTKIGNTCGTSLWSIYVISIPNILDDTYITI